MANEEEGKSGLRGVMKVTERKYAKKKRIINYVKCC